MTVQSLLLLVGYLKTIRFQRLTFWICARRLHTHSRDHDEGTGNRSAFKNGGPSVDASLSSAWRNTGPRTCPRPLARPTRNWDHRPHMWMSTQAVEVGHRPVGGRSPLAESGANPKGDPGIGSDLIHKVRQESRLRRQFRQCKLLARGGAGKAHFASGRQLAPDPGALQPNGARPSTLPACK